MTTLASENKPIPSALINPKLANKIGLVVLQIVLTLFLITFLLPALWMISSSLKVSTEVFAHPIVWIPESPRWQNYMDVFKLLPFGRFALNTFIVTGLAVIGTIVSSLMVGYSFTRLNWPGKNLFFGLMRASTRFIFSSWSNFSAAYRWSWRKLHSLMAPIVCKFSSTSFYPSQNRSSPRSPCSHCYNTITPISNL
jgi:ABC-type glycerol-3-phosphate transport system permease component